MYKYFLIFVFVLVSCDPGGYLALKNGHGEGARTLQPNGPTMEFRLVTIRNINFSLEILISTNVKINVIMDSLNICHNKEKINYRIRHDGEVYKSKTVEVKSGSKSLFYGFDLDRRNVKKGDEIILYAKYFVEQGVRSFDLDTVIFVVDREY